eukprot:286362_1
MKNAKSKDALKCPIYLAMKLKYEFTEKHLNHLDDFTHFQNEFHCKPKCKYGQECAALIRLQNGGQSVGDRGHAKIYKHPPRKDRGTFHSLITSTYDEVDAVYYQSGGLPSDSCSMTWDGIYTFPGYHGVLIDEVINNGFKHDLCLKCSKNDECKHDKDSLGLIQMATDKLNHFRHQQLNKPLKLANMLALILYLECDCGYDLHKSHKNGYYRKWAWLDYCIRDATSDLSGCEKGSYKLYCTLELAKLKGKEMLNGYFATYTLTSWLKNVSESYVNGDDQIIIEIDEKARNGLMCCDVSWISKFPDECGVVFARSLRGSNNSFDLRILEDVNGKHTGLMTIAENEREFPSYYYCGRTRCNERFTDISSLNHHNSYYHGENGSNRDSFRDYLYSTGYH